MCEVNSSSTVPSMIRTIIFQKKILLMNIEKNLIYLIGLTPTKRADNPGKADIKITLLFLHR